MCLSPIRECIYACCFAFCHFGVYNNGHIILTLTALHFAGVAANGMNKGVSIVNKELLELARE
jgi:hypothetical protein